MNTRILKIESGGNVFFAPQQNLGLGWTEFFGYEPNSQYIHPKIFLSSEQAEEFLLNPSIWIPKLTETEKITVWERNNPKPA